LQRPLPYRPAFYVHCALLHLSLLIRIGGDLAVSSPLYKLGGILNVVAILVFVGNTATSIARGAPKRGAAARATRAAV